MLQVKFDRVKVVREEGYWLCLRLYDTNAFRVKKWVAEMPEKVHQATLSLYRAKRSKSANDYAWALMGQLASKLNIPKEEVYLEYVREIGNNFIFKDVPPEQVGRWKRIWNADRLGWLTQENGPGMTPGTVSTINYYGSSVYNTKQMSDLINLIVYDCKAQGIATETPEEQSRMLEAWDR